MRWTVKTRLYVAFGVIIGLVGVVGVLTALRLDGMRDLVSAVGDAPGEEVAAAIGAVESSRPSWC